MRSFLTSESVSRFEYHPNSRILSSPGVGVVGTRVGVGVSVGNGVGVDVAVGLGVFVGVGVSVGIGE